MTCINCWIWISFVEVNYPECFSYTFTSFQLIAARPTIGAPGVDYSVSWRRISLGTFSFKTLEGSYSILWTFFFCRDFSIINYFVNWIMISIVCSILSLLCKRRTLCLLSHIWYRLDLQNRTWPKYEQVFNLNFKPTSSHAVGGKITIRDLTKLYIFSL